MNLFIHTQHNPCRPVTLSPGSGQAWEPAGWHMPSNSALGSSLRRLNYLGRLLSHHLGPFDLRQLELMFPLACIWKHGMCVPTTAALVVGLGGRGGAASVTTFDSGSMKSA